MPDTVVVGVYANTEFVACWVVCESPGWSRVSDRYWGLAERHQHYGQDDQRQSDQECRVPKRGAASSRVLVLGVASRHGIIFSLIRVWRNSPVDHEKIDLCSCEESGHDQGEDRHNHSQRVLVYAVPQTSAGAARIGRRRQVGPLIGEPSSQRLAVMLAVNTVGSSSQELLRLAAGTSSW